MNGLRNGGRTTEEPELIDERSSIKQTMLDRFSAWAGDKPQITRKMFDILQKADCRDEGNGDYQLNSGNYPALPKLVKLRYNRSSGAMAIYLRENWQQKL